jgi:hypothetical protein
MGGRAWRDPTAPLHGSGSPKSNLRANATEANEIFFSTGAGAAYSALPAHLTRRVYLAGKDARRR